MHKLEEIPVDEQLEEGEEEELTLYEQPREAIQIKVGLEAKTPLMMHKYSSQVGDPKSQTLTKKYDDEWKETCYTDFNSPQKYLCVPAYCIEASILAAGKSRKVGKFFLGKYIASGVSVNEQFPHVLVDGKELTVDDVGKKGWIDIRGAVVNKNRVDRRRACIPNWRLYFTISLDSPLITPDILKEILIDASTRQGLLDQRPGAPSKPGKFGQFRVVEFTVL